MNKTIIMGLTAFLLLAISAKANLTLTYNQTMNNQNQTAFNESFTDGGTQTFYINLPKNSTISGAFMNITGMAVPQESFNSSNWWVDSKELWNGKAGAIINITSNGSSEYGGGGNGGEFVSVFSLDNRTNWSITYYSQTASITAVNCQQTGVAVSDSNGSASMAKANGTIYAYTATCGADGLFF